MATIFGFLYVGCTLAPPEEYNWTVHVRRWWRRLMSNYFDHLLVLLLLLLLPSDVYCWDYSCCSILKVSGHRFRRCTKTAGLSGLSCDLTLLLKVLSVTPFSIQFHWSCCQHIHRTLCIHCHLLTFVCLITQMFQRLVIFTFGCLL